MKRLLGIGLVLVLLTGCSAAEEPEESVFVQAVETTTTTRPTNTIEISYPSDGLERPGKSVNIYGKTEPGSKVVSGSSEATANGSGAFKLPVPLKMGSNYLSVRVEKPGFDPAELSVTVERVESKAEKRAKVAKFKASCKKYAYKVLDKDADKLVDKPIKLYGQIFHIEEADGITVMQVNVTNRGYGIWDDQVWVNYDGALKVYKDDMISVWGTIAGSQSYESVAGWQLTVPSMDAKYVTAQ